MRYRSSHPLVFLRKGVLKIYSKFTGGHPYRSVISIKFQSNFIEIALRHGCSPANLQHIFRTPFPKSTSRGCFCGYLLLLKYMQLKTMNTWNFKQEILSSQLPKRIHLHMKFSDFYVLKKNKNLEFTRLFCDLMSSMNKKSIL